MGTRTLLRNSKQFKKSRSRARSADPSPYLDALGAALCARANLTQRVRRGRK